MEREVSGVWDDPIVAPCNTLWVVRERWPVDNLSVTRSSLPPSVIVFPPLIPICLCFNDTAHCAICRVKFHINQETPLIYSKVRFPKWTFLDHIFFLQESLTYHIIWFIWKSQRFPSLLYPYLLAEGAFTLASRINLTLMFVFRSEFAFFNTSLSPKFSSMKVLWSLAKFLRRV